MFGKLLKVNEIVHRTGLVPRCALLLQFPFSLQKLELLSDKRLVIFSYPSM